MTGLTQAHEVVHRVRSALRDRLDVVNLLHRGKPTSFETYLAERMCRRVPVTDTSPRMPVLFTYVRGSLVLVILATFFHTMFLTDSTVHHIGWGNRGGNTVAWVCVACGFSPPRQKPPRDFSRRWLSARSFMILLYHIVNEKSSTILLISCHTEAGWDEDTKSHRGIAPTMASLYFLVL